MGEAEEEEDMEVAGRCQMIKAWTEEVNESSIIIATFIITNITI
jgi:hypothetical protein